MQSVFLLIFVGLVAGVAVGIQGPMSSVIAQRLGTLESVFIVHLGGVVVALGPLLLRGGGNLKQFRTVPWYILMAGGFGMVLIAAVGFLVPRVGISTMMVLLIAGQLIIGAILDHYGLLVDEVRPVSLTRVAGLMVVFIGVWLSIRE